MERSEISELRHELESGAIAKLYVVQPGKGPYHVTAIGAEGNESRFLVPEVLLPSLIQLADSHGIPMQSDAAQSRSVEWLAENWLSLFMVITCLISLVGFQSFQKKMGLMSKMAVKPQHSARRFQDVAGVGSAKQRLLELVSFLKEPKRYGKLGGKLPHGILLVGPPGTGKTLLAEAVAGEAGVPVFVVSGSEFVEMYAGLGAARVRELFAAAKKVAPCIIFIDELDALGSKRTMSGSGNGQENNQTLNQLLVEMAGFGANAGIIVLAATNRPDTLDKALTRPGRFDERIEVSLPTIAERRSILEVVIQREHIPTGNDVDLDLVARATAGFSGADIVALMNRAAVSAGAAEATAVTLRHIEDARDAMLIGVPGSLEIFERLPQVHQRASYHEAGHAVLAFILPDATLGQPELYSASVGKIGRTLGRVVRIPIHDLEFHTLRSLIAELAIILGGRVGEELREGATRAEISAGAEDDLRFASDLARRMVLQLGLGSRLGLANYSAGAESPVSLRELDPQTAREAHLDIADLLSAAHETAMATISANRWFFEAVVLELMTGKRLTLLDMKRIYDSAHVGSH